MVLKGVNWVHNAKINGLERSHNDKIGSNGLERINWVHNTKIRSNGLERSQLGTQ